MIKRIFKIIAITVAVIAGLTVAFLGGVVAVLAVNNQFYLPVTLQGEREITVEYGASYEDAGATAQFYGTHLLTTPRDVPVTAETQVDTGKLGTQEIKYVAQFGNFRGQASRTVHVVDTTPPEIALISDPDHYTPLGETYQEEGFTATDNFDGDLTAQVQIRQDKKAVYYTVTDSSGNEAAVKREIVYKDDVPPAIGLEGERYMTLSLGAAYEEPGYVAGDNLEGNITKKVKVSGKIDSQKPGVYTLKYTVTDSYGNKGTATRKVTVVDKKVTNNTEYPDGKVIYLTFDDGPGKYTGKLLDILQKYNVKATFFVTKKPKYYRYITRAHQEGHAIAIHTMSHTYKKIYASTDAYYDDLYGMQDIIKELTGETTTLLRFPGGSSNTVSKKYCSGIMSKLTKDVELRGFQYFDWNVDSNDAGGAESATEVYNNVIKGIKKKNYAVVLQHDIKGFSVDAVERIIVWGLENGYSFQPLTAASPTCHHRVRN